MYAVAAVLICVYIILYLLAKKETPEAVPSRLLIPFYRMALYLYKRTCAKSFSFFKNRRAEDDLQRLYPGEDRNRLCTVYYVRKLALFLIICFVGTFLGGLVSIKAKMSETLTEGGTMIRGDYKEGEKELIVKTSLAEGGEQVFRIFVLPQRLSRKEADALKKDFGEKLPWLILGKNVSLTQISHNLCLEESFEGFPYIVEWKSSRPDLISGAGIVGEAEGEGEAVTLTATVNYEDLFWEEVIDVCVVPPTISSEERIHRELEEFILISEKNSRGEEEWKLPETFKDERLSWQQVVEDNSLLLWLLAMAVAFMVYLFSDKDLHKLLLDRRISMKKDYPDTVHKLALYLGAGMTIRGTFQKMSMETETKAPIYQEILFTCRELKNGVPERNAYEHFGKRTGLQEYVRLSTLLTQNLKKGNAALLSQLREEAQRASAEKLLRSRRMSEEAGTKLLVPMIMMLAVVMLMIIIPAFSSMGV